MVTKKIAANTTKLATETSALSKPKAKNSLKLNKKNVLTGDLPPMLDLREIQLTHKGEIRIEESDTVEFIHLPDGAFSYVVIAGLPNLKEIHAHGRGPTWLDCQELPSLKSLVIDSCTRWLNVDHADTLSEIDVGNCEQLGYLSVQLAPQLSRVNIEKCRLLLNVQGISTDDQERLGLTKQMQIAQAISKKSLSVYPQMTGSDIEWVLDNIWRGAAQLKMRFPNEDEEMSSPDTPPSFRCRLLEPGEKVYTGGTGESYCYAFEVFKKETKGKKSITYVLSELGIHEPEEAIAKALGWVSSTLGLANSLEPTEDQLLTYLRLSLSDTESDPASWTKIDDLLLRREMAANPLMTSHALEQLGGDEDPQTRFAVAKNPATDFKTRQRLLHGLVKEKDSAMRVGIAQSEATAVQDLETLSQTDEIEILCAVAENSQCPSDLRKAIFETLSTCGETRGLILVASSTDAPGHVYSKLLTSPDQHVIVAIAENIGAPEQIRSSALAQLADSDDPRIKQSVARNPLTPPAVLESLAKNEDPRLLGFIVKNPATPSYTLEHLAKNNDWSIRCGVAENHATPPSALLVLSKDTDELGGEYIRKAVAGNHATPVSALKLLIKEKDWQTRSAVAKNMGTPKDLLEILASDKEYSVRESVAKNSSAAPSALDILSTDQKDNIKMFVAKNSNTSADTLIRLSVDPYFATRREVATNAATPTAVLQFLLNDADQQVRTAAEKSLGLWRN
jgi:hypothetical protein